MKKVRLINVNQKEDKYSIYFDQGVSVELSNRQDAQSVAHCCADFFTKQQYAVHVYLFGLNQLLSDYGLFVPDGVRQDVEFLKKLITENIEYCTSLPKGPNWNSFLYLKTKSSFYALNEAFSKFWKHFKTNSNTAMVYKIDYYRTAVSEKIDLDSRLMEIIKQEVVRLSINRKKRSHDRFNFSEVA